MPFLSIEQRKAGSAQLGRLARLIDDDIARLQQAERGLVELKRTVEYNIADVERSIEGELDADRLEAVDTQTRERVMYGITHYPVRVVNDPKQVVTARQP